MNTTPTTVRAIVASTLVSLLLAGCASERVKAENKAAKEKKDGVEYVDYYPVGSNIPVRVPKDQIRPTDSETNTAENALRNVQRNGSVSPKDPSGG